MGFLVSLTFLSLLALTVIVDWVPFLDVFAMFKFLFSYSISGVAVCFQDNSLYRASLDCSRRTKSIFPLIFHKLHLPFDLFLKSVQDFVPFLVPNVLMGHNSNCFLGIACWVNVPQRHLKCLWPLIPDLAPSQYALQ